MLEIGNYRLKDPEELETPAMRVFQEQLELIAQSEEHGLLKRNGAPLAVGAFVLAVPGPACTMTVKYSHALVVNKDGEIGDRYEHDAQNR